MKTLAIFVCFGSLIFTVSALPWQKQMSSRVRQLENQVQQVLSELEKTKTKLVEKEEKLESLVSDLVQDGKKHTPVFREPIPQNEVRTLYACPFEIMYILCDPSETLFITNATYGVNPPECTAPAESCCAPSEPADCRATVDVINVDEWLDIRRVCNYETNCAYQFQGLPDFQACDAPRADYLELKYVCATEETEPPVIADSPKVAFYTYALSDQTYDSGRMIFDGVVTNIGNAYSTATNTFTCPYDGLYVFHLTLASSAPGEFCIAEIDFNGARRAAVQAGAVAGAEMQSANTVYLEAQAGDTVFIEIYNSGNSCSGGDEAYTTFSGNFIGFIDEGATTQQDNW